MFVCRSRGYFGIIHKYPSLVVVAPTVILSGGETTPGLVAVDGVAYASLSGKRLLRANWRLIGYFPSAEEER
jgi:hypothetical protein